MVTELSKEEIAKQIVELTNEYTARYRDMFPDIQDIDGQLWAALHIGFLTGLKTAKTDEENTYDDKTLGEALTIAQQQLTEEYKKDE